MEGSEVTLEEESQWAEGLQNQRFRDNGAWVRGKGGTGHKWGLSIRFAGRCGK